MMPSLPVLGTQQFPACPPAHPPARCPELQGKVRDTYDLGDKLVIVTTDRQSAFDRLLAAVPFKGQVLNQTSAWWMHHTTHIVQVTTHPPCSASIDMARHE
jgi:hypothetical protein